MSVLPVTRINPQNLTAVRVSMGANGAVAGRIAMLQAAVMAVGYQVESLVGPQYPGGWRLKFMRGEEADQFAYPNDWILVTDATYSDIDGWTLQPTSAVHVYGVSTGLIGTATDFVNTFHVDMAIDWPATTGAPAATADAGAQITITFPAPASADGPWTWEYTLTDHTTSTTSSPTTFTPTPGMNGDLVATITGLTAGHDYSSTISLTDHYSQTATSLASNTVTAAA